MGLPYSDWDGCRRRNWRLASGDRRRKAVNHSACRPHDKQIPHQGFLAQLGSISAANTQHNTVAPTTTCGPARYFSAAAAKVCSARAGGVSACLRSRNHNCGNVLQTSVQGRLERGDIRYWATPRNGESDPGQEPAAQASGVGSDRPFVGSQDKSYACRAFRSPPRQDCLSKCLCGDLSSA
jgi:hypothetical protein